MIEKLITYCGQSVRVACDGNCVKAWGINNRPRVNFDPKDPDDYVWLSDAELGDAPADPGTYEGGHAKPRTDAEKPNKWCVRECERMEMSEPGQSAKPVKLRTFTERRYNMPWKHRTSIVPGTRIEVFLEIQAPPGVWSKSRSREWVGAEYLEQLANGRHRVLRDAPTIAPNQPREWRILEVDAYNIRILEP